MADYTPLTIADAENAYKGILELVLKYPNYPSTFTADNSTVQWNMTNSDTCIGLFPLGGAVYLRRYVSGGYVGLLPFEVVYKTTLTTNKANIGAHEFINGLCRWLETCSITFSDTRMTLESIERTTPPFIVSQDEKNTELAINMQLTYSFK